MQIAGIERAADPCKNLTFLYVIDINSLGEVEEMVQESLRLELKWMGNTLLRIAERRAQDASLKAELVIREGTVRDEICRYVIESGAHLLMLGAPRGASVNIFGHDEIETFADSIHATTGVPVEIIRPKPAPAA